MKRLILLAILLGGISFSQISFASIWSWVNETTPCKSGSSLCLNYHFTISDWDVADETPNPCYNLSKCTIFIGHRHYSDGTSGPRFNASWNASSHKFLIESKTMGELGKKFKEVFALPFSGIANHIGKHFHTTEECVGIFYAAGKNLKENDATATRSEYRYKPLLPGSICGIAPPPTGNCSFGNETLTLDHKKLLRREIEGNETREDISIECSTPIALKLYIFPPEKLNLRADGSIYSEIYINDKLSSPNGFSINVNGTEKLSIKSRLHMNGKPEAGPFNGSAVMLIAVE